MDKDIEKVKRHERANEVGYGSLEDVKDRAAGLQRERVLGLETLSGKKNKEADFVESGNVITSAARKGIESHKAVSVRDGKVVRYDELQQLYLDAKNNVVPKPRALERLLFGNVSERTVKFDSTKDARTATEIAGI